MNNKIKVYEKFGRKFSISKFPKPGTEDMVFFQEAEWIWISQQNLSPEEFGFLWNAKKNDFAYSVIPEKATNEALALARAYVPGIVEEIKKRGFLK